MTSANPQLPVPDQDGNYDSPPLRALRLVWSDHLAGIATPEHVMDVIAELGRFAQHNLGLFETKIESGESDPEDPGFSLIIEAFELILEGCEHMALEFVDPDPDDDVEEPEEGFFVHGLALVQEATNQMMEGHQLTLDYIASISQVNCPFCGQPNSREGSRCRKCGRALPQNEPAAVPGSLSSAVQSEGLESAESLGDVTENFVLLARAVAGWNSGNVGHQELASLIDHVESRLLAHLEETESQQQLLKKAPPARQPALAQAVEMTQEALDQSLAAIERMRLAFEKEDDTYLHLGLSDFQAASRLMVRSFLASKAAAEE
jgi:hypothetical protein